MDAAAIHERLAGRFGEKITGSDLEAKSPWSVVAAEAIVEVARYLKDDPELRFDNLMCLSAVDLPKETPPRMELVYHLFSYEHRHTFAIKAHVPRENPELPTVETVWRVANWHEREAFDMFGIRFAGHSDLRRILLPDDWEGHPLRKDYPVQVKVPVKTHELLQVTQEEFVTNIERQRRALGQSAPGAGGRRS
jgi:NADH-quinone oxidoreductase subunit C